MLTNDSCPKRSLGLDIDGVVTAAPDLFLSMAQMWVRTRRGPVHFITARAPSDAAFTRKQLTDLGFGAFVLQNSVHHFPEQYPWPFEPGTERYWFDKHAQWKADVCVELNIALMVDDNKLNIDACVQRGIPTFHFQLPRA